MRRREIKREIRDLKKDGFTPCAIFPKEWLSDEERQKAEAHPDYIIFEEDGAIRVYRRVEDAPQR